MTTKPILQSIVLINGEYGLKYLKLVKSPSGSHHVIDVMFMKGLRLTTNLVDGESISEVKKDFTRQILQYREQESGTLLPIVDIIAECAARALSDEKGRIAKQIRDEMAMKEAWESTLLAILMRRIDPSTCLKYEEVEQMLQEVYAEEDWRDTADTVSIPKF